MAALRIPADVDLVVSFSHAVAKAVRVPRGVPHVCYCFTPMRYAWERRADYFALGPVAVGPGRPCCDHAATMLRPCCDHAAHGARCPAPRRALGVDAAMGSGQQRPRDALHRH